MSDARWVIAATRPAEWSEQVARVAGGFFHTPAAAGFSSPGEPMYATLVADGAVRGVALGTRRGCRLSIGARHAYFPTLPAVNGISDREAALAGLVRVMRRLGAAEVVVDSFDAAWRPAMPNGVATPSRLEFLVWLDGNPDELLGRCGRSHRRYVRRGERGRWRLTRPTGKAAVSLLGEVTGRAAHRAVGRGDGFAPVVPAGAGAPETAAPFEGPWGVCTFAACEGDTPLAAALIGWGHGRAFYVVGGSTRAGYRQSAAVWLHWSIIRLLAAHGLRLYNLGGTPAGARDARDAAHGLFRFKRGFGAEIVERHGGRWVLSAGHVKAHTVTRRIAAALGA